MKAIFTSLTLAILSCTALAQSEYSAKSLFFAEDNTVVTASTKPAPTLASAASKSIPDTKPATTVAVNRRLQSPSQLGASYFIRLKNSDGSFRDVLASRKFQSGERFQLGIKVNRPTYIYILNEESDGKVTQIYPQPGRDNMIDAMGTVFLPNQGTFEFDNKPGIEQLLVYLSPTASSGAVVERIKTVVPDLVSAPLMHQASISTCNVGTPSNSNASAPPGMVVMASTGSAYSAKGITFQDEKATQCATPTGLAEGYAAKGIVFSDDPVPASGGQVASYVVKKESVLNDRTLFLKIKLVHE